MRRLALSLLFVVIASIFGLGWALDHLFYQYSSDIALDELSIHQRLGQQLAHTLDNQSSPHAFIEQWPAHGPYTLALQQSSALPLPPELAQKFQRGEPLALESHQQLDIHYYLPQQQLVLSVTPQQHPGRRVSGMQAGFTALFYLGMFALTLLWLYPLISRLIQLRRVANRFGGGDLSARLQPARLSYISDIETEFNRMAARIQTLIEDNKLLSSAVSHDLRTPLARLRFGIDTLSDTDNPQAKEKYLTRISSDLDEMERLVESLLRFARLDHTLSNTAREPLDLAALAAECLRQYHDEAIAIDYRATPHLAAIDGSSEYLAMVLNNLLQNALRYATGQIHVSLQQREQQVVLQISDDGPGVAAEHRDNVLKPFNRGGATTAADGYGLGLAIVHRIAEWHHATLQLDSCPTLGGARFTIAFPMAR
jgi:two-component system OmpR family sensor kinase